MSCWERDFLIKVLEECAALNDLWIPCIDSYRLKEEALFHVVGGWGGILVMFRLMEHGDISLRLT